MQFAGTPFLTGGGFTTGLGAMSFTASAANLVAGGSLSGVSHIQFTEDNSFLGGIQQLTGVSILRFAATSLNGFSGIGRLTGIAPIQVGTTGSILGAGHLAGVSSMIFVATLIPTPRDGPFFFEEYAWIGPSIDAGGFKS